MALRYGKAQMQLMVDALSADYETVDEAAAAALETAEAIFRDRAKFVVVGQLRGTLEKAHIPTNDPDAIRLSLGWYSTEGDAIAAAGSLWHSTATGDHFGTLVLPVFHGTPAELHAKRKEQYAKAAEAAKEKRRERMREDERKRREAMEERARGGRGSCEPCGHQPWEHAMEGSSRGKCRHGDCACPKWKEKTK